MCLFLSVNVLAQGQSSIKDILVDSLGKEYIIDSRGILNSVNSNIDIYLNDSETPLKKVRNTDQEVLIFSKSKIYELTNDSLKLLCNSDQDISQVFQLENFLAIISDSEVKFWNQDTSFNCPLSLPFEIINVEYFNDKFIAVDQNGITELCDDFVATLGGGFVPTTLCKKDNYELLFGSQQNGIWSFENDAFKKLYFPGVRLPQNISKLNYRAPYLWILDQNKNLFNLHWERQLLTKVAQDVQNFNIDKWHTVHTHNGFSTAIHTQFINDKLPHTTIQEIRNINGNVDIDSPIKLESSESTLTIILKSFYSPGKEKIKYKYRINSKSSWIDHDNESIHLQNIPAGNNTFELKTSVDGKYFSPVTSFIIRKEQSIFKTFWPYIFAFLGLMLLLAFFSQRRLKREITTSQIERNNIKLELETLKAKQQLGLAKLNPHFLFNTLNSINGLIALNENSRARKSLTQFSKMMRSTLEFSSEENISIEDEVSFLKNYLNLEKLINNDTFDYTIKVDEKIKTIPPMITQPFVENAIIHGFKNKKGYGTLSIEYKVEANYILVHIEDDGIGREAAKKMKRSDHDSSAIKITEERLQILDHWGKKNQYIKYQDLHNSNIPSGTRVTLSIAKQRI